MTMKTFPISRRRSQRPQATVRPRRALSILLIALSALLVQVLLTAGTGGPNTLLAHGHPVSSSVDARADSLDVDIVFGTKHPASSLAQAPPLERRGKSRVARAKARKAVVQVGGTPGVVKRPPILTPAQQARSTAKKAQTATARAARKATAVAGAASGRAAATAKKGLGESGKLDLARERRNRKDVKKPKREQARPSDAQPLSANQQRAQVYAQNHAKNVQVARTNQWAAAMIRGAPGGVNQWKRMKKHVLNPPTGAKSQTKPQTRYPGLGFTISSDTNNGQGLRHMKLDRGSISKQKTVFTAKEENSPDPNAVNGFTKKQAKSAVMQAFAASIVNPGSATNTVHVHGKGDVDMTYQRHNGHVTSTYPNYP
ncbi:hypothetical protein DFJ73DRAFT_764903 [Zopfochytrium polystomum]|nr:hypothetical protein DFJ73DRAFT_764903 [Zopfochytrium polystomum]